MTSKVDQAIDIAAMRPLPDNAEEQIKKLAAEARGFERDNILSLLEAVFVARNKPSK